ncbi:uncharacterized protein LOC144158433 [Haemaphysalis longicornis]
MSVFGQSLQAKEEKAKIFYAVKALPYAVREMVKVFFASSSKSNNTVFWSNSTKQKYASVKECAFKFYNLPLEYKEMEKTMKRALESLLAESAMLHPLLDVRSAL